MKCFLGILLCLVGCGFPQVNISTYDEYIKTWNESVVNPSSFWDQEAHLVEWDTPYSSVWKEPTGPENAFVGSWFVDGKINAAYNCVDRWAKKFAKENALIWISEEDTAENRVERIFTYKDLSRQISRCASALKSMGVQKGDRVAIWLPMLPELIISQLACAKIGAIHTVIFSGFSAKSVQERILDSTCKVVITTDEALRRGKTIPMKESLDPYLEECPFVEHVVVVQRTSAMIFMKDDRDVFWDKVILQESKSTAESMNAEDPLFILYTSGTTGKPKGIVHSTGGYLVYVTSTMKNTWKPQGLYNSPKKKPKQDVWFCTADIGWITGHSYITYAPLALGMVVVIYEGAPTYPHDDKLWEIIDRHHVSLFYTSPTLIRSLMAKGESFTTKYSLSSLRVLGSVGEPINPEAWMWYYTHVGKNRCPIIDTYWQTETGGYVMAPIAGVTPLKAGYCSKPCFGIQPVIVKKSKALCIAKPWPGMMRTIYGDHERFLKTYLYPYKGLYFTGDKALIDKDGLYRILGRMDDVIKVSGHRLGTAELENAITSFSVVAEAAVVGVPDDIKGQSIVAFVVLKQGQTALPKDIQQHVRLELGAFSVPKEVIIVDDLPKTRSGKIVRRLLQALFLGNPLGDTSTLANPDSVEKIQKVLLPAVKKR
jgi:acetyl-CoA synthetase